MNRFSGLSTLILTLLALAILSFGLAWPLWSLATAHRQAYALLCGSGLVLAILARLIHRRLARKARPS
mgnify:CR=1 FL=1